MVLAVNSSSACQTSSFAPSLRSSTEYWATIADGLARSASAAGAQHSFHSKGKFVSVSVCFAQQSFSILYDLTSKRQYVVLRRQYPVFFHIQMIFWCVLFQRQVFQNPAKKSSPCTKRSCQLPRPSLLKAISAWLQTHHTPFDSDYCLAVFLFSNFTITKTSNYCIILDCGFNCFTVRRLKTL